jgi:hypothetical protein
MMDRPTSGSERGDIPSTPVDRRLDTQKQLERVNRWDGYERGPERPGRVVLDSTWYPITLGAVIETDRWTATVGRTTFALGDKSESSAICLIISHSDGRRGALAVATDHDAVPESWRRDNPNLNTMLTPSMERNTMLDLLIERLH